MDFKEGFLISAKKKKKNLLPNKIILFFLEKKDREIMVHKIYILVF
jgi:hypothetical protein